MASYTLAEQFRTLSITTTGDTVKTRNYFVRVRNLGANFVSFSEVGNPTGAPTAAQQSSVNAAPAGGNADNAFLRPNTTYFFRAATGATLVAFDEYPGFLSY